MRFLLYCPVISVALAFHFFLSLKWKSWNLYNFSICWSPAGLGLSKNCFIWSPAACLMRIDVFRAILLGLECMLQPQSRTQAVAVCAAAPTLTPGVRAGNWNSQSFFSSFSPQCLTFWGLPDLEIPNLLKTRKKPGFLETRTIYTSRTARRYSRSINTIANIKVSLFLLLIEIDLQG